MILFIEDSTKAINQYKKLLNSFDNILIFSNYSEANYFINTSNQTDNIKCVICDHNFPINKDDQIKEMGHLIQESLLMNEITCPFIHFSRNPCPEKYQKQNDFFSLKKDIYSETTEKELHNILSFLYKKDN